MTINEIKQSSKVMLLPADIAPVLGCDPQSIRVAAQTKPQLLGFPVCVLGRRVSIPRVPFLKFIGEEITT